ncbi:MAG: UbiA prenyltransferase family protein [Candidatus Lokiarchaeota archaeon]|nr:UbiA prenyltransferase family protein [Candidatus Lokiarchaeota archaeon]
MTSKIRSISHLLRVRQYYKNVLIFVGVFFSRKIFDTTLFFPLILGFILLCCASSFNYIINDIVDVEHDKKHQEKMNKKPLASGELPMYFAALLLIVIVGIIVFSVIFLIPNISFITMLILIILTGQLYNYFFKNYAFIDILVLSTGYLWRALSGVLIINEYISAWLFLAIFEIAMFLSIAKRKGDLLYLGKDKAVEHKRVYDQYSLKLLEQFYVLIAGSLFMTYSLYLILKFNLFEPTINLQEYIVIFTIPISLYIIMRFMYLTSSKPELARRTEKAFLDKGIIISGILLFLILFSSFYFDKIITFFIG